MALDHTFGRATVAVANTAVQIVSTATKPGGTNNRVALTHNPGSGDASNGIEAAAPFTWADTDNIDSSIVWKELF